MNQRQAKREACRVAELLIWSELHSSRIQHAVAAEDAAKIEVGLRELQDEMDARAKGRTPVMTL